jgi:hypothetical protein
VSKGLLRDAHASGTKRKSNIKSEKKATESNFILLEHKNLVANEKFKIVNRIVVSVDPTEEQKVTVTGIYQKVKKVGRCTFYNEIEAKDIK